MRSNYLSCETNWKLTFLKTVQLFFWGGGVGFKVMLHGTIRNDDF